MFGEQRAGRLRRIRSEFARGASGPRPCARAGSPAADRRPSRSTRHRSPSTRPAGGAHPTFAHRAAGRDSAQHHAGRLDAPGIDARRARRVADGLEQRDVKLPLHRLEQLEHTAGAGCGEACGKAGAPGTAAQPFDYCVDEIIVAALRRRAPAVRLDAWPTSARPVP
jgi:hypothetical protein